MQIAVIGGCGRLGFRLSLIASNKGHKVQIIDLDEEKINEIKNGSLPFVEKEAEVYLDQALKNKSLSFGMENELVTNKEIIIITLGTPVDSNLNPSLEPVAGIIFDIAEYLKKNQLIIFRNIMSPGILKRVKTLLEDKTGFKVGRDIFLAFAPETGIKTIHDLTTNPQPIGAFDEKSYNMARDFFKTITKGKITFLTPEEALLAKLMENAYEYIQSACANEFYLIAESFNANLDRILNATNNKIPNPNPNAAGPGMHKEGWFLVENIPFAELILAAFKINESMPGWILRELEKHKIKKVAILGMTARVNSDDARGSLSYKLRKLLYYKDYMVGCFDPYLPEYSDSSVLQHADAVILMTGHDGFKNLEEIKKLVNNPACIYVDIMGFWQEAQKVTSSIH